MGFQDHMCLINQVVLPLVCFLPPEALDRGIPFLISFSFLALKLSLGLLLKLKMMGLSMESKFSETLHVYLIFFLLMISWSLLQLPLVKPPMFLIVLIPILNGLAKASIITNLPFSSDPTAKIMRLPILSLSSTSSNSLIMLNILASLFLWIKTKRRLLKTLRQKFLSYPWMESDIAFPTCKDYSHQVNGKCNSYLHYVLVSSSQGALERYWFLS